MIGAIVLMFGIKMNGGSEWKRENLCVQVWEKKKRRREAKIGEDKEIRIERVRLSLTSLSLSLRSDRSAQRTLSLCLRVFPAPLLHYQPEPTGLQHTDIAKTLYAYSTTQHT